MTYQELVNKINFKKILPTKKNRTKLTRNQMQSKYTVLNIAMCSWWSCVKDDQKFICHELQSEHDSPKWNTNRTDWKCHRTHTCKVSFILSSSSDHVGKGFLVVGFQTSVVSPVFIFFPPRKNKTKERYS